MNRLPTNKKVELELKAQGRNKSWLANELGITRPVLYSRLKDNFWTPTELMKLKAIGLA